LRTLLDLPLGVHRCLGILKSFQPQVVVGVGGYASGPGMLAALLRRTPTLAFEPNAVPGLANRLVGRWVNAAAVNFAPACRYFRNAEVTGIPVRSEFFALPARPAGGQPHLLVFGGSQGARGLNNILPQIASRLLEAVPGLTILHQAGARHAETTQAAYASTGADPQRWQVLAFLDDMPQRFAAADLVVCRSGASTVAELSAAGKPAVLVPFPLAADDHQRSNAEVMAKAGAAVLMPEAELTPEALLACLQSLFGDRQRLHRMGEDARQLARPDAAARIAAKVKLLAGERR
jgi:UDP-N-acetylglucosamine--N-acetylmuramyl-(pentapeptide) pyrophosphoryl-undecaprenol N-acetylglucosamine transferase